MLIAKTDKTYRKGGGVMVLSWFCQLVVSNCSDETPTVVRAALLVHGAGLEARRHPGWLRAYVKLREPTMDLTSLTALAWQ